MSDRVSISIDSEGIADVRLNRPDKMNACDLEMIEALSTVGSALAKDRSLRAVVLSGEGPGFLRRVGCHVVFQVREQRRWATRKGH